jgi:cytochrome c oxidase assembly factor CtaG/putative copper export protein
MRQALRITTAAVAFALSAALALGWAFAYGNNDNPAIMEVTGPVVRWGLPAAKLVFNLAAAATIGTLVLAAFALPPAEAAHAQALRLAGYAGTLWSAAAVVFTAFSFLSIANIPLTSPSFRPILVSFLTGVDAGRFGLLSAAIAGGVAFWCFNGLTHRAVPAAALLAFTGLIPLILTSHATGGVDHPDATTALLLHTGAAAVWLGGLLALVLLRRAVPPDRLPAVVLRYSTLALASYIFLAASGVLTALAGIGSLENLATPYSGIVLAKAAVLAVLGLFGVLHRRWSLKRLERDPGRGGRLFAGLAAAELTVMAAASGLAAALARTETPAFLEAPAAAVGLPAPGVWAYLSEWEPDPLWSLLCGFAAFCYLAGVRRLHRSGVRWPVRRTACWLAGVALLAVVTNGGLHVYQGFLFSSHVLSQMMLTAVVPLLLVPAAPLTLAELTVHARTDGSTGVREFLLQRVRPVQARIAAAPYLAVVLLAGTMLVFYYSPLLAWSARSQLGYSLMSIGAVLTGCLLLTVLKGRARSGQQPAPGPRMAVLGGTAAVYALYGWALASQAATLAQPWIDAVGRPWSTSWAAAAELAGPIVWTLGAGTLMASGFTFTAAHRREGRRIPQAW